MSNDRKLPKIVNKYRKYLKCAICEESRVIEICHLIPFRESGLTGIWNLIALCPTHHKLYDKGLLTYEEKKKMKSVHNIRVQLSEKKDTIRSKQKVNEFVNLNTLLSQLNELKSGKEEKIEIKFT